MDEPYRLKFRKIKLRGLESRFENLDEDCKDVSNQLAHTTNAQDKNNLERQLATIFEELQKVGTEIDQLKEELQKEENDLDETDPDEALQALIYLLSPLSLDIATKAYRLCLSEGRLRSIPETWQALVHQLARMPEEAGELRPLLRFVRLLIQEPSLDSDRRDELRMWTQPQGLPPEPSKPLEMVETCLMVKVEPRSLNDPSMGYLLSAAIAYDPNPLDPEVELKTTAIAVPEGTNPKCAPGYSQDELPEVLSELIPNCTGMYGIPLTDLVVQWFLPIELMSLPIEHWQIRIGRSQKPCNGQRCKAVIVRSYDRHFLRSYQPIVADWKKYWTRLINCLESQCTETLVHLDPVTRRTRIDWSKATAIGCKFVEHNDPQQQVDFWDNLLSQGVSIALWVRQAEVNSQTAGRMMKLVTQCSIAELPTSLAQQRQKALSKASEAERLKAAPLCLLWDNPFRPFPKIDYQSV